MNSVRYRVSLLFTFFLMMLCLYACGDKATETSEENVFDNDLVVVGVSQVGSESVWRTANTESIQNVITKDKGYFLLFDNARQKQENQIKAIRSFISQKVDYIVFSPITENGWDTVLLEAKEAGIPVILMDRKVNVSDSSLYTSWVGSDFEEEGAKAGRWLESYLSEIGRSNEVINIVVLKGTEGSTSVIGRSNGFLKEARKHFNWRILEEVDGDYTTSMGEEAMSKLLKQYSDIDVVISQNDDMTFGALEALENAGVSTGVDGDIILISFDAVKAALELVSEGIINADIECNPAQGEYVEKIIDALVHGQEVEKEYFVPEMEFDIKNVGEYLNERAY